jgi:hypothetical protein
VEGRSGAMAMEVARAPFGPGQLMSLIINTFYPNTKMFSPSVLMTEEKNAGYMLIQDTDFEILMTFASNLIDKYKGEY